MVREIIALVVVATGVIAGAINRHDVLSDIEETSADLLTQVQGTHTPASVVSSLHNIEGIHTDLYRTIRAYNVFLERSGPGDSFRIKNLLGDEGKWNAYDHRLWGLVNDLLAMKAKDETKHREYLALAQEHYESALALSSKEGLIGDP